MSFNALILSSSQGRTASASLQVGTTAQNKTEGPELSKSFSRPPQLDDIFPMGSCRALEMQDIESRSDLIPVLSQERGLKIRSAGDRAL